ncbi:MAG: GntR family transcriptional regulator [Desulfobacteraceae bacterium]|nr:GntR family transcriptional regulator [Desulfobacteraceae bacterium]MBU4055154.1 GntR family transcriptional regulator [Pseudomonadota bacterium]
MLNIKSPVPLYHQLADILSEKIRVGEYPEGSRIPSEHQLAAECGIGRPTVRQATDLLVRKGLLVRKRGSGTYVNKAREEVDVLSLAGTLSSFQKKGRSFSSRIPGPVKLIHVESPPPNPFCGTRVFFYERITEVEGQPVLLEDIYLSPILFPGIDQLDLDGQSLSRIAEDRYDLKPVGGKQDFRVGVPAKEKAYILKVSPETPVLLVNRFIHFQNHPNGLYSDLYCRTDRFVFSQILGGFNEQ